MIISTGVTGRNGNYLSYTTFTGKSKNRVSSTPIPPVPKMRSNGQCRLSEKELAEKMVKMAKKDAAAGTNSMYAEKVYDIREPSAEFKKLRDNFISLISPDRNAIIKNTLSEFAGHIDAMNLDGVDHRFEFFEILMRNSNKFDSRVKVNLIQFCDENGELVATYSSTNGWNMHPTRAEGARNKLFDDLWKQALADAQEELELEQEMAQEEFEKQEQITAEEVQMSFLV